MERLFTAVDRFTTFTGRAVAQLYLLLATITVYEVVMRYLFNKPTLWAFELVIIMCATAWMLSVGYITQQKGHIGITILYLMMPPKVQWYLDLFSNVVGFFAISALCYASVPMMHDALTMHELSGTAFNSPEPMIAKTILVMGSGIYAVQLLVNTIRHLQEFPKGA
ncbi:MAG: TRAP transporter small permease subunit [Alphaproteobacteria bacterium]|nr:TRAP transporter small permease subunit [Alphaproteobacteria bacterium]